MLEDFRYIEYCYIEFISRVIALSNTAVYLGKINTCFLAKINLQVYLILSNSRYILEKLAKSLLNLYDVSRWGITYFKTEGIAPDKRVSGKYFLVAPCKHVVGTH